MSLLTALRRQLDDPLRAKHPMMLGKLYPLSQCLEIAPTMWKALKKLIKAYWLKMRREILSVSRP